MTRMAAIVAVILFFFIGCEENRHSTEVEYIYEELEISLMNEPLVYELIRIKNEITSHIISNEIDISQLQEAYVENDEEKIKEIMGFPADVLNKYEEALDMVSEKLLKKYPMLVDLINDLALCSGCPEIDYFDNIEELPLVLPDNSIIKASEKVKCKWVPYTASLLVCSASGPIIYWPCAYVAICAWCEGGWVNDACFKE